MTGSQKQTRVILGFQYFIYFGVMGIYLPYFNLYCYHLNFSGFEIGVLSAVRTLAMVAFSLLWGAVADQYSLRKPIYIICNFVSAAVWAFFFFTTDFWPMLAITLVYSAFYGPIIAFLEAITMEALGAPGSDKRDYGNIRVWGSLNFIIVVVLLGKLIDSYPINIIIILVFSGSLIQALFSVRVPGVAVSGGGSFFKSIGKLINRRTGIFLVCSFLMLASHGTYYGFFSIHLENLGYGNTFIGVAWGLATVSEILVMVKSDIIFKRFAIKPVLIVSFIVAAIRWVVLYYAVTPGLILFAQILHAITYGSFHIGCILYMDMLTDRESKTFGQVANNAVSYGLGIMSGFLLNGVFFEHYGPLLYIMSSGMALAGGVIFFLASGTRSGGI